MNIRELAEQATCDIKDEFGNWIGCEFDKEKFAALVAAHEREECAKLCEAEADDGSEGEWDGCCLSLANKIRARGKA